MCPLTQNPTRHSYFTPLSRCCWQSYPPPPPPLKREDKYLQYPGLNPFRPYSTRPALARQHPAPSTARGWLSSTVSPFFSADPKSEEKNILFVEHIKNRI